MNSFASALRVFARVEDPSDEMFEYLAIKEGVQSQAECWVDLGTPRDFEWSSEIVEKTVEFGLADETGEILATFGTLAEAEKARQGAKLKFAISFGDEDEEERPKGAPAKPEPVQTTMDSKTGDVSIVSAAAGL